VKKIRQDGMAMKEDSKEVTLADYWQVIYASRRMILTCVLLALVISVVVSLLLPETYRATARILPPQSGATGLASLIAGDEGLLGTMAGSLAAGKTPAELYVGILQSRSVADKLAERFGLKKLYRVRYREDVYRKLARFTEVRIDRRSRIISVSVEDRDPVRAAAMANTYVEALDGINRRLNISEGQKKSRFLEQRLKKVEADLKRAEDLLRAFQEKYRLVSLQQQAEAVIKAAAELRAQIIASRTRLEVLRQFGTERQNEAVRLRAEIKELERQLARLEGSSKTASSSQAVEDRGAMVPLSRLPELGLELARLTREAKIQEKLYGLITSQYELAKIEAARDVNVIQVLDRAVAPEKKAGPNRPAIVMVSCFMALMFAILLAFVIASLPGSWRQKIAALFGDDSMKDKA